jgi:hypothetical protein
MTRVRRIAAAMGVTAGSALAFGGLSLLTAPAASADTPVPWAPPGCVTYAQPQSNSVAGFLLEGIAGDTSQTTTYCDNRDGAAGGAPGAGACTADTAATAPTPDTPGVPGVPGTCSTGQRFTADGDPNAAKTTVVSPSAGVAAVDGVVDQAAVGSADVVSSAVG